MECQVAILQRHREYIHQAVIQRFATGRRIVFLGIVGTGPDHIMRVMAGADDDFLDFLSQSCTSLPMLIARSMKAWA